MEAEKQKRQYNLMLGTLRRIVNHYQTPDQLRKSSEKEYGLDYEETLEMAYENIQNEAKAVIKNVKYLRLQDK